MSTEPCTWWGRPCTGCALVSEASAMTVTMVWHWHVCVYETRSPLVRVPIVRILLTCDVNPALKPTRQNVRRRWLWQERRRWAILVLLTGPCAACSVAWLTAWQEAYTFCIAFTRYAQMTSEFRRHYDCWHSGPAQTTRSARWGEGARQSWGAPSSSDLRVNHLFTHLSAIVVLLCQWSR